MQDNDVDPEDEPRSRFPSVLIVVGAVAVLFALVLREQAAPPFVDSSVAELKDYGPAPGLFVEGWTNGKAPLPSEMDGKVVVIEAFATWCGPCREFMPHVVEVEQKFRDRGVMFLSMTTETEESVEELKAFADEYGMTWPIAYGADDVLIKLGANGIPSSFLVNREGRVVWSSYTGGSLESAIELALASESELEPAEAAATKAADAE